MQREHLQRAGLPGLALLCLPVLTGAQGYVVDQAEIVAAVLDDVPGLPGVKFAGSGSHFDFVSIAADGTLGFRASLFQGGVNSTNDRAIMVGKTRDDLAILLRDSDPAPGLTGVVLNSASNIGLGSNVRLSKAGHFMFGTGLGGASVVADNDSAIYAGLPGALQIVARESDPAPGTVGARYSSSFTNPTTQFTGINELGTVIFKSDLDGGDTVPGVNDEGLFSGSAGSMNMILRTGDTLPDGSVVESLGFLNQIGHVGQVLHAPSLSTSVGSPPAQVGSDRALYISLPGIPTAAHFLIAREGDPAPGTQGAVYGNATDFWNAGVSANCFSSALQVAFQSALFGGDAVINFNDRAIFVGGIGGVQMVVRRNDPAPGTTQSFEVFNNSSLKLNVTNTIAFQSSLQGAGINDFNDTGIWTGTAGNLQLVAREGEPVPGMPGLEFGNLSGWSMHLDDLGQLLMSMPLFDPLTQLSAGHTLWSWDPESGLRLALQSGDQIEMQPGVMKTISTWSMLQFNNGGGAALSFNHDGQVGVRFNMSDGMAAVGRFKVGSLVGVPEGLSTANGGVQELFLDAGQGFANDTYLVLGSASGSSPGLPLDGHILPLNLDSYTDFTLASANSGILGSTLGLLDAEGRGQASWTLPAGSSPSFAGLTFDHAYVVIDIQPGLISIGRTSQAARLEILP